MLAVRTFAVIALALGALGGLASAAAAQDASVTVRALGPQGSLEGVEVRIGALVALTGGDGTAAFRLPLGTHEIRALRLGFADAERTLVLHAPRDTLVVIEMEEEALEGEEIVVLSTRSERRIEDEPLRVEVVSREEVEEKLLMTPGDISMLLNETAGLRVQPTAPSLGGASVRIQGLRGRYTQILSDGLPLYGGQAGALGPLQVPPMDLAQVEVIKGAASALYGSTALGGVVNLISRRPERARELLLNQGTLGGTDVVGWSADELGGPWGYTLLASAHRHGRADPDADGWADVPTYARGVVRPRLFWSDGAGSSAMVTVGGMVEDRTGGTLPGRVVPDGSEVREALDTRRLDGGFVGRRLISDRRSLSARASASLLTHEHGFDARRERDRHRTAFGEVALSGQDGAHLWVVGAALQYDGYRARDVDGFDFDHAVPALFVQDEWTLLPSLTVAASARADRHDRFGTFVSPRVSALLRPGEWVVRLSAGSGYFAPTPFTEETESVGLGRVVPGADLVAERARSGMADIGRVLGPVELNLSAFGSEIDHAVVTRRAPDGTLSLANATERVLTWGTEVLARVHQGPLHLTASHAWLRSTEPDPAGGGRREVVLTPRHSAGLVGAWEVEGRGRAGVELYYTGRQALDDDPYRTASAPHVVLGFLVDRRFGRFRVFLIAENVLDTRQTGYDPLVRPARTADGRWTTDVWAPLEGRSFNGGVWITF